MPVFKYEARYEGGETATGIVEAISEVEAVAQLRKTFEVVLDIKEVPKNFSKPSFGGGKKIKTKSLALISKQFAIILQAGLPLVQTVKLVAEQSESKELKDLWNQVAEDISGGWSLSYSLEQRAPYLPTIFRESIRAGEDSGDLESAFARMSDYYSRVQKTRSKTITTLSYPALIIVVAVIVISIIMGFAVPVFTDVFEQMDAELPPVTLALIAVSDFFQQWFFVVILLIAAIICGLWFANRTPQGSEAIAKALLSLPVFGNIIRMSAASQFAHTMSAMLAAGMPIMQALEVTGRTIDNKVLANEVLGALPGVEDGRSVGTSLALSADQLPEMLVQMTTVGEKTGSMEDTLQVLARYYDNEVDTRTDRVLAMLEPIIIVVLSLFVVFILLAVYLPMFNLYQQA